MSNFTFAGLLVEVLLDFFEDVFDDLDVVEVALPAVVKREVAVDVVLAAENETRWLH